MRGNIWVSKRVNMEAFQLQTKTDKWADNGTAGKNNYRSREFENVVIIMTFKYTVVVQYIDLQETIE